MPERCGHFSRANARSRVETSVCPQGVEAGGRIVPLAFWCWRHGKGARNPGDWLAGCNAGREGGTYVYPTDVRDHLAWSARFIRGRAQPGDIDRHLQRLAGIRITPRFARPLWELCGDRR